MIVEITLQLMLILFLVAMIAALSMPWQVVAV